MQLSDIISVCSPFAATFSVPLSVDEYLTRQFLPTNPLYPDSWSMVLSYFGFTLCLDGALLATMYWLLTTRWRVAQ
ncbi:MAG: hypothetical protein KDA92_16700, partial [Planctomycetales bacterium]|nr:hypothetical protein [Planctomycetales bacterium]